MLGFIIALQLFNQTFLADFFFVLHVEGSLLPLGLFTDNYKVHIFKNNGLTRMAPNNPNRLFYIV